MNWFNKLLEKWACKHKWFLATTIATEHAPTGNVRLITYLYICKKCGKFKRVEV